MARLNFSLVIDREGQLISAFSPKILRYYGRISRTSSAACESSPAHPFTEHVVRLVRHIGWWGSVNVQTKIDGRDATPKLMEVNPKSGLNLWHRTELGINEPLMCVKIARGEPVEPAIDYPLGCLLLKPIEDVAGLAVDLLDLAAYRLRTTILRGRTIDPSSPPRAQRELLASYREQYFGGRPRRFSPYFRYGLEDPLPSLIWSSKVVLDNARLAMRGLGR
jgi:hypothetical protein